MAKNTEIRTRYFEGFVYIGRTTKSFDFCVEVSDGMSEDDIEQAINEECRDAALELVDWVWEEKEV
jgi:hypothetical protein